MKKEEEMNLEWSNGIVINENKRNEISNSTIEN